MVMTQGGGRPQTMNFTANDYCTGLHLAAGVVLALLARTRGVPVTSVEGSLMLTATVFQSEHVAELAVHGRRSDAVGDELRGPSSCCRLYEASDGWVTVCAVTRRHREALGAAFGLDGVSPAGIEGAIAASTAEAACLLLRAHGVPAAISVHPSAVPDDPQVIARGLLATVGHPVAGRFVQVGIPLRLSVDAPAVKGPAPAPARWHRPARSRA